MAFKYGGVVYPVQPTAGSDSLLRACDPALAKLLEFLSFMVTTYGGDVVSLDIPATDRTSYSITAPIAQVAPVDPDTIAKSEQWQFPLFAAWRKSTKYNHKTLNWVADVTSVGLAYILPPLTGSQLIRWQPFLTTVSQICNYALKAGFDPAFNDGERIVVDNDITSIKLVSADFGSYDFAGNAKPPYFPAWVADLELEQKQTAYTVGIDPFEGADFTATHHQLDNVSTVISANAAIAAVTVQVASTEGFDVLDVVVIGEDTAREETISVAAIPDATHLTLAAAGLVFAHTAAQADTVKRKPVTIVSAKSDVG